MSSTFQHSSLCQPIAENLSRPCTPSDRHNIKNHTNILHQKRLQQNHCPPISTNEVQFLPTLLRSSSYRMTQSTATNNDYEHHSCKNDSTYSLPKLSARCFKLQHHNKIDPAMLMHSRDSLVLQSHTIKPGLPYPSKTTLTRSHSLSSFSSASASQLSSTSPTTSHTLSSISSASGPCFDFVKSSPLFSAKDHVFYKYALSSTPTRLAELSPLKNSENHYSEKKREFSVEEFEMNPSMINELEGSNSNDCLILDIHSECTPKAESCNSFPVSLHVHKHKTDPVLHDTQVQSSILNLQYDTLIRKPFSTDEMFAINNAEVQFNNQDKQVSGVCDSTSCYTFPAESLKLESSNFNMTENEGRKSNDCKTQNEESVSHNIDNAEKHLPDNSNFGVGSLDQEISNSNKVYKNPVPNLNLPTIHVSPETILRVQKVKAILELKYEVLCCFEGTTSWLDQDQSPPCTGSNKLICTKYNPLQTIRNRKFRQKSSNTDTNQGLWQVSGHSSRSSHRVSQENLVNPFHSSIHHKSQSTKRFNHFRWNVDVYELFSDLNWQVSHYNLLCDKHGNFMYRAKDNIDLPPKCHTDNTHNQKLYHGTQSKVSVPDYRYFSSIAFYRDTTTNDEIQDLDQKFKGAIFNKNVSNNTKIGNVNKNRNLNSLDFLKEKNDSSPLIETEYNINHHEPILDAESCLKVATHITASKQPLIYETKYDKKQNGANLDHINGTPLQCHIENGSDDTTVLPSQLTDFVFSPEDREDIQMPISRDITNISNYRISTFSRSHSITDKLLHHNFGSKYKSNEINGNHINSSHQTFSSMSSLSNFRKKEPCQVSNISKSDFHSFEHANSFCTKLFEYDSVSSTEESRDKHVKTEMMKSKKLKTQNEAINSNVYNHTIYSSSFPTISISKAPATKAIDSPVDFYIESIKSESGQNPLKNSSFYPITQVEFLKDKKIVGQKKHKNSSSEFFAEGSFMANKPYRKLSSTRIHTTNSFENIINASELDSNTHHSSFSFRKQISDPPLIVKNQKHIHPIHITKPISYTQNSPYSKDSVSMKTTKVMNLTNTINVTKILISEYSIPHSSSYKNDIDIGEELQKRNNLKASTTFQKEFAIIRNSLELNFLQLASFFQFIYLQHTMVIVTGALAAFELNCFSSFEVEPQTEFSSHSPSCHWKQKKGFIEVYDNPIKADDTNGDELDFSRDLEIKRAQITDLRAEYLDNVTNSDARNTKSQYTDNIIGNHSLGMPASTLKKLKNFPNFTTEVENRYQRQTQCSCFVTTSIQCTEAPFVPAIRQQEEVCKLAGIVLDTTSSGYIKTERAYGALASYSNEIMTLRRTKILTPYTRLENLEISSDNTLHGLSTTLSSNLKKATERMDRLDLLTKRAYCWNGLFGKVLKNRCSDFNRNSNNIYSNCTISHRRKSEDYIESLLSSIPLPFSSSASRLESNLGIASGFYSQKHSLQHQNFFRSRHNNRPRFVRRIRLLRSFSSEAAAQREDENIGLLNCSTLTYPISLCTVPSFVSTVGYSLLKYALLSTMWIIWVCVSVVFGIKYMFLGLWWSFCWFIKLLDWL